MLDYIFYILPVVAVGYVAYRVVRSRSSETSTGAGGSSRRSDSPNTQIK